MRRVLQTVISLLFISTGLVMFLYSDISEYFLEKQTNEYIEEFEQKYYSDDEVARPGGESETAPDTSASDVSTPDNNEDVQQSDEDASNAESLAKAKENDPLYQEVLAYNTSIYESGQAEFKDAWSYVQSPINIKNLENGSFGYIRIPAMKVKLPLYLGASDKNMSKGAAILGQTSIPIGGVNTNSVIAGHRGWRTGSFFKQIERLKIGDHVFIKNPWETLAYQVESIDITGPYASEEVKIQEGKDMVTLVTCHPYLSHGNKYRYIVYCVRDANYDWGNDEKICAAEEVSGEERYDNQEDNNTQIISSDGTSYESSDDLIRQEELFRMVGAAIIVVVLIISSLKFILRR